MTSEQQMVLFTLLSFFTLGLGSIVLSTVTIYSHGPRALALILAGFQIFMGVNIYFLFDPLGWAVTALGVVSLVIAVLPKRKRQQIEE